MTPPMTSWVLLVRSRQSFMLTKTKPPLTSPPKPTTLKYELTSGAAPMTASTCFW